MASSGTYEHYRNGILGQTLADALDELVESEKLSPELAIKTIEQFDQSIHEALATKVKSRAAFKASLHTYRFCDNMWTFILENAEFKLNHAQGHFSEVLVADKVKIVACDAKLLKHDAPGGAK
mmetsp:Transcript_10316/g.33294  ORF Transcript_10316/g.33294 Transcript_10316/m.33294 type:complete len:123 (+) Transcript_10316:166-534(+)|eukprot:CAMPEP_0182858560 /NCGR_PEP_ID=MMETSP0034_2-20130328/3748_1 /TAXON_ID=156128 /ORGANISM="Nephroselmis pyriformis, Strain CCMP717" /LENGTH=122 /DNA_ID=CAMNT_0024990001 /DNA_START=161 /DNA_END=529 /DNA_ORIENTATION=+